MTAPVIIWGAGAVGGTVGAYLHRAGHPVVLVDAAADHVARIRERGLRIEGPIENFAVHPPARLPEQIEGPIDTAFLCVKAHHTVGACRQIAERLSDRGCVVSLQNGLNELAIAQAVGAERTVGAFVNFGADYLSPGVIHYAGHGAVVVGEVDGRISDRSRFLHGLLRDFDDRAALSDNILGYLWSKLSYGSLLYATALTNEPIADVFAAERHRAVLIALVREILSVTRAEGVTPESFDGYSPLSFENDINAIASLDAMVAHNRKSAKSHSGIWRDLVVRKRPTEVDAQLGPMVELARRRGIPTPILLRLIGLIHDVEAGLRKQGDELLASLGSAHAP